MNYSIFRKPSRYIGNEINIVKKEGDIKVALCFPDTYEIGMSHLGLKILYSIINNMPHASAERVFAPWIDFEAYLRQNNLLLTSLENKRPLKDFDIVGFTLQYELSYTNVLNMLDLGGIPVKSEERGDHHPLVIAGGPCAMNPVPLTPFIDAFVIGDGEDVIKEIIDEVGRQKGEGRSKEEVIKTIAKLDGVYVPAVHNTGNVRIKKRIIEDLDKAPYPDAPVLPYTSLVHDRIAIEVARGCTRGCRFCQAGMTYRPLRERSMDKVLSLARNSIASTGYEEISFASLSTGDYSCLLPLIQTFNRQYEGAHISVSLPSLRVGSLTSEVLKEIKSVRKTGFTIAPEAGTSRLRNVINKDFSDEEYEETLKKIFSEGWKHIKLYFMIGLPTETMDDINGIIDMATTALRLGKKITGRRVDINVGVSCFVPKPHTPFQWTGQNDMKELREKQDYIRRAFRKRGINFKGSHVETSLLESVFSRADKNIPGLLEEAWKVGCRFDAWTEHFNFDKWMLAAEKTGINLYDCATYTFDPDWELPWDIIDTGVTKKFLQSEYRKSLEGEITQDCRKTCYGCGLECDVRKQDTGDRAQTLETSKHTVHAPSSSKIRVPGKLRVKFSKMGEMRYLSHNELITSILRSLKRAKIPVTYSEGFHPHPKISFGPALPSGVEGSGEFFDIELSGFFKPDDFLKSVNSVLPDGLILLSAVMISQKETSLNDLFSCYEYEVIIDKSSINYINLFMSLQSHIIRRDNKSVDIRPLVKKAEINDDTLNLVLIDTPGTKARLHEILQEILQKSSDEINACMVKRIGLYGYNSDDKINSMKENTYGR